MKSDRNFHSNISIHQTLTRSSGKVKIIYGDQVQEYQTDDPFISSEIENEKVIINGEEINLKNQDAQEQNNVEEKSSDANGQFIVVEIDPPVFGGQTVISISRDSFLKAWEQQEERRLEDASRDKLQPASIR